ncbi:MAG TPA: hypothetical protein VMJ35_03305 [Dongiaceae bacterium]|nr:hypothetical protein [Dongiaceae bacterium]
MPKRYAILFLLGIVTGLPLTPETAFACICNRGFSGRTMRDVAAFYSEGSNSRKVVFEGLVETQDLKTGPIGPPINVLSMTPGGTHRAVSVRVLHVYRGQVSGNVIVLTGMGIGDCGFDFETGKQYLVYADRIDAESLFTSICTGTSSSEQAGPALRFLRGEKPTADDLLEPEVYYEKVGSKSYGTACGRVTKTDGTPLNKGLVGMTQVRVEPFPPMVVSDPDLSKPDGSFCIRSIRPGRYLLTAERPDYDTNSRWMGFYPGVTKHSDAVPIEVHAGDALSDLHFSVQKERVYTLRFRIVAPNERPLPLEKLGVSVDSSDRDELAYHLTQNRGENGWYSAGYVPPGHYVVQTFIQPDFETGTFPAELSRWRMAKQEVDVTSDSDIVLTLYPAK